MQASVAIIGHFSGGIANAIKALFHLYSLFPASKASFDMYVVANAEGNTYVAACIFLIYLRAVCEKGGLSFNRGRETLLH